MSEAKLTAPERLAKIFAGRTNVYGTFEITGKKPNGKLLGRAATVTGQLTQDHWIEHVAGRKGIGICPIKDDGTTCQFGCIDIDLDMFQALGLTPEMIVEKIRELGFELFCTRSKSDGLHCWYFSHGPVPATDMRSWLSWFRSELKLPEKTEIFPRQDSLELTEAGKGSWVNMPWMSETRHSIPDMPLAQWLDRVEAYLALPDPEDVKYEDDDFDPTTVPTIEVLLARTAEVVLGKRPGMVKGSTSRHHAAFTFFVWMRDSMYSRDQALETVPALVEAIMKVNNAATTYNPAQNYREVCFQVYRRPPQPRMKMEPEYPKGYFLRDRPLSQGGAVLKQDEAGFIKVCTPLKLLGIFKDIDTGDLYNIIKVRDYDFQPHISKIAEHATGPKSDWTADLRRLARFRIFNTTAFVQFWNHYDSKNRGFVASKTGWCGPLQDIFVLPEKSFGTSEPVELIGRGHRLYTQGTSEEWRNQIGVLCKGNHALIFAASIPFAAVMNPIGATFGSTNRGFHFYGASSKGKTTALEVCGSICGASRDGGHYWRSFDGTRVGLEMLAAQHNCVPLLLDEIGLANGRSLGEMIYSLMSGEGKARGAIGSSGVTAAASINWHTMLFTSGEKIPEDMIRAEGKTPKAGQAVRLVNIPVTDSEYGLFDTIQDFASGEEFANLINERVDDYYGAPLRAFLEKICENKLRAIKLFSTTAEDLALIWSREGTEEVPRVAQAFALVAAGGVLAAALGITGFTEQECIDATKHMFDLWLKDRETTGSIDQKNWTDDIRHFVAENYLKFEGLDFKDTHREQGSGNGTTWVEKDRPRGNVALGYRKTVEGVSEIWVKPDIFKRDLCKGHMWKQVATDFKSRGILIVSDPPYMSRRLCPDTAKGHRDSFFVLSYAKLMGSSEATEAERLEQENDEIQPGDNRKVPF